MNLSVVAPVYRGEHLITALGQRLGQFLPDIAEEDVILGGQW